MAKMGYIHGQGLGRDGEGRAEPVPIMLLPQGWLKMKPIRMVISERILLKVIWDLSVTKEITHFHGCSVLVVVNGF